MKALTPIQIAFLYLILFQLGESDESEETRDKIHNLINPLLEHNKCPIEYIPDEDGAPVNAPHEVYVAYNEHILGEEGQWYNEDSYGFISDGKHDEQTLYKLIESTTL